MDLIKAFMKWRFERIVRPYGYHVVDFDFLPYDESQQRIARLTPIDDGFEHTGDDCACIPIRKTELQDNGEEYTLIRHRTMNAN
jgi:hypothetical protein